MNPLDALSALTQVQPTLPGANVGFVPTGPASPITQNFQLPQPTEMLSAAAPTVSASSVGSPNTWGHMVQQMVLDVNSNQQNATQLVTDVLKGGPTPVHEAMVATEEASLSFEFLSEMRNKVVDAYQQVMQMQV